MSYEKSASFRRLYRQKEAHSSEPIAQSQHPPHIEYIRHFNKCFLFDNSLSEAPCVPDPNFPISLFLSSAFLHGKKTER